MKAAIQILAIVLLVFLISVEARAQASIAVRAIDDSERSAMFPSRDLIEFGRAATEANCAGCHGMDGLSDAQGKPQLAGQRTVYLYRVMKAFQSGERKDGLKNHNTFLNDQALLSTAVYYAGLTPSKVTIVADTVDQAETSGTPAGMIDAEENPEQTVVDVDDPFLNIRGAMKKCIKCHGESGEAEGSGMPSLTGQDPDYFVASMMAYVNGDRSHKLMKRLSGKLDEASLREMGVFYAVQEPLQTETLGEGDINVGHRLAEDCSSCHGVDGNAKNPNTPTLAGQDAKYFIKAMNHYRDGKRKHQKMFDAVEALSEQEITDLASFYAVQEPRRRDVRMPLKSTEWITRCERCHGIDGNSSDPRFPMLAGQDETYLRNTLKAYANGARENTAMFAMTAPLSAMDIERISAHFSSQQPKAVVYMQLPCGDDQQ